VGRLPGNSISEIEAMVNKTLYYETAQNPGEWMNRMFLAAAIQDIPDSTDLDGEQEVWLANKIIEESVEGIINYTLLAESTQWGTNLSQSSFRNEYNLGQSLVFFAGHGGPTSFNGQGTTIFTSGDANNLQNYEMPALVYADACSTNMFDNQTSDNSMGEAMIKNERGGAIGYIGSMRLSYYYVNDTYSTCSLCELNRGMARLFFQEFFLNNITQQGKTLNEMRKSYLNSVWLQNNPEWGNSYNIHEIEWERKNVLTYNLLGDPEVDIFTQEAKEFGEIFGKIALYYEGIIVEKVITDDSGIPVPNARISLIGEDGAYKIFKADASGKITVNFPLGAQSYNYTLTGHNMIPKTGEITILEDTMDPNLTDNYTIFPNNPNVNDKIRFILPVNDNNTTLGSISCGVVVLSEDGFESFDLYELPYDQNLEQVDGTLPQLRPGSYSYILFAYDYAQNYAYLVWDEEMAFKIPISVMFIIVLIANVGLVGFIGYFIYKKYSISLKR
jgi:hypothetical protein